MKIKKTKLNEVKRLQKLAGIKLNENWEQNAINFLKNEIEYSEEDEEIIAKLKQTLNKVKNGNFKSQKEVENEIGTYYEDFTGLGELNENKIK
jgi:hypothetical protein